MTIPVSTVPAAKAYLFGLLTSSLTAADTTFGVFYGPPGQNQPNEIVSVAAVTDREVTPLAFVGTEGAFSLQESYTIPVALSFFHGDEDAVTLDGRMYAVAAQVEMAVRSDPQLGGLVSWARPQITPATLEWGDDYNGLTASMTIPIACYSEI